MTDNLFYGWYDDATQPVAQPSFDPPHDGPCLFCGKPNSESDIRTHSLMMMTGYARRAYFYRTHRTCAEHADEPLRNAVDDAIWCMVTRNGD